MKKQGCFSHFLPRLATMLFGAFFLGAIGNGPKMMNMDGDLGRHLTIGQYILDNFRIPRVDIFSFTMAGQPLTPHEWLSEVVFAVFYRWLGLNGVILITALVIGLTLWLVFKETLRRSQLIIFGAGLTILCGTATAIHWLTRPHIFTFLFLALWTYGLDRIYYHKANKWWWLPVAMLVWVNLHGAFITGFVTWGIFVFSYYWDLIWKRADETPRPPINKIWLIGGISLAASLVNPAGLDIWKTGLGFIGNRFLVDHTLEYLPPDFHSPSTWPFLLLVVGIITLMGFCRTKIKTSSVFLSAAWIAMGLYSARNIPLCAIVMTPILVEIVDQVWGETGLQNRFKVYNVNLTSIETSRRLFSWGLPLVVGVVFLFSQEIALDFRQQKNEFKVDVFPVKAVDWLVEHPQREKMFNYFTWGGYLLFRLWPDHTVFIDGQTDFYGESLTRQYQQIIEMEPGWLETMNTYQIRMVIIPTGSRLAGALLGTGWKVCFQDNTAVILSHE